MFQVVTPTREYTPCTEHVQRGYTENIRSHRSYAIIRILCAICIERDIVASFVVAVLPEITTKTVDLVSIMNSDAHSGT